jgi:hypothetical protein
MAGRFDVVVTTALSPRQAWDAVTSWPAHGRHVPLTSVRVTKDAGGLGDEFVGRTGFSVLGFDDPMRVTGWVPPEGGSPGRCDVTKQGRVVTGWARIEVDEAGGRTRVRWVEEVGMGPAWLGRVVGPVVRVAGGLAFRRVLRRLLADAERGRHRAP